MKKILLIMAILVGQVFASVAERDDATGSLEATESPGVRFVCSADLADGSPTLLATQKAVGAIDEGDVVKASSWLSSKTTMQGQIDTNVMRRIFVAGGSFRTGRMPLGVQPWFYDVGSADHHALRGEVTIDALTIERLGIIIDLYDNLVMLIGKAPSPMGTVRETRPDMPLMLINKDVHAANITFLFPLTVNPVALQDEVAKLVLKEGTRVSPDSNITELGTPSFIISQLPFGTKVAGSASTVVLDLPYDTGLKGITPTLITCLTPVTIPEFFLKSINERVAAYRERAEMDEARLAAAKLAAAATE